MEYKATNLGGGWWHDQRDCMKVRCIGVEPARGVAFVGVDDQNVESEE